MNAQINHPGKDRPADTHDQAMPKPGRQNVNPVALELINTRLRQRNEIGIQRYNTTLQTFNQRDVFKDFEDEFTDAWQYYTQIKLESAHRQVVTCQVADALEELANRRTTLAAAPSVAEDLNKYAAALRALWPVAAENPGSTTCKSEPEPKATTSP